jgi:hypothetical protein
VERDIEEFYERLQAWPPVLFLGQQYLALESGSDVFLAEVVRKFGRVSNESVATYAQVLGGEVFNSPQGIESSLAWMEERCDGRSEGSPPNAF